MLAKARTNTGRSVRPVKSALSAALVAAAMLVQAGLPAAAQAPSDPKVEAAAPLNPAATPSATASETPSAVDAAVPPLPAIAASKVAKDIPHDLTPIGMFMAAGVVVKAVMVLLAAASVVTWAVFLMKVFELMLAKRRMRAAIRDITAATNLDEASAGVRSGVAGKLLGQAEEELRLSAGLPSEGIKERLLIALQRVETSAGRQMGVGTGILATIGSTGPFVGLLGTVWGVMDSFIGISKSNTTSLAVVAPGIAEALLATAIGLVAAIPAVIIYNSLARSTGSYKILVGDAVALIMRHVSRDLDGRQCSPYKPKSRDLHLAAE